MYLGSWYTLHPLHRAAMIYRFVQLSDIHFGQETNGTLITHEDVFVRRVGG